MESIAVSPGPPTVLVVEDDADTSAALREFLQDEGFEVAVARNGAEAIAFLQGVAVPRVMLIDLTMPGLTGEDLVERLKADARLAAIPTAIISASPERAPTGVRAFSKPIDIEALVDFVRGQVLTN